MKRKKEKKKLVELSTLKDHSLTAINFLLKLQKISFKKKKKYNLKRII